MKICPAILTNNVDIFQEKLRLFQIFDTIDIDFITPGSVTSAPKTLNIKTIFNELNRYPHKNYRVHLMCDFPFEEINRVVDYLKFMNILFIVHQESSFNTNQLEILDIPIGLAIKHDTELREASYYQNFSLIQVMSVDTGAQGNKFEPNSLELVNELRELGYDREVSLDGGINLETISLIAQYSVDSLSVGSYFVKSLDIEEDKRKLEEAIKLNLKQQ
jgi:ribulose-phosphate 3-epimerase